MLAFHSSLTQLMVLPTLSTTLIRAFDQHCAEPIQCTEATTAFFHIHFLLDLHAEMTQHREVQTNSERERSGLW